MRNIFVYLVLPLLSALLFIGGILISFSNQSYLIYAAYFLLIGTLIYQSITFYRKENSKPIIKLIDFGFDIKEWKGERPSVCAFIEVKNDPSPNALNDVNSKGVFPTITWVDKNGESTVNNGRWLILNDDQEGAIGQLTVDLDANGLSRKLHFTYSVMQIIGLQAFWRTEGSKWESKMRYESSYDITIHLRDKSLSDASFYFRIKPGSPEAWPHYSLRLERLNRPNGKVIETRKFDFMELDRFEKEKGYIK